jgi:hypothetical protein
MASRARFVDRDVCAVSFSSLNLTFLLKSVVIDRIATIKALTEAVLQ